MERQNILLIPPTSWRQTTKASPAALLATLQYFASAWVSLMA
jgi:hypothetical protein